MRDDGLDSATVEPAREADYAACETILRQLPQWFGIEESIVEYTTALSELKTLVVRRAGVLVGFLALKTHNSSTAEIHIMAVDLAHHRTGIGTALVKEVVRLSRSNGHQLLEVKTLGPSHPDEHYAATRRFYRAMGFLPLEELHGLWPDNPCLIMVKVLEDS